MHNAHDVTYYDAIMMSISKLTRMTLYYDQTFQCFGSFPKLQLRSKIYVIFHSQAKKRHPMAVIGRKIRHICQTLILSWSFGTTQMNVSMYLCCQFEAD